VAVLFPRPRFHLFTLAPYSPPLTGGFTVDILEGMKTRKSIRAFTPKPVTREVMKKILDSASNSPSYTNTQPWEVVVVSGGKKNELSIGYILLFCFPSYGSDYLHGTRS
jgi:hypothetical protein